MARCASTALAARPVQPAGQQGVIDILYNNATAYWYNEASSTFVYLSSNVAAITAGTDYDGNYMIAMLFTNGDLYESHMGSGWTVLDDNVQSIGKAHAGVVDEVFTGGDAWAHAWYGWSYLTSSAQTAA
jgi:hypothetical protein